MQKLAALALLPLLLSACATAGSCNSLPLLDYPANTRQKLAAELEAAPPTATWPGLIVDYARLRDDIRACQARTPSD